MSVFKTRLALVNCVFGKGALFLSPPSGALSVTMSMSNTINGLTIALTFFSLLKISQKQLKIIKMRKGTFLSYFLYDPWHQSNALFLSWSCDGGDSKERIKEDKYTNASSRSWDAPPLYNSNKLMSCFFFFNFNGIELHYICDSLSHSSLSYLHRTTKMKSISVTHHILHTKHKQHQVIIEKYEPLANLDK